ncbi:hypothetical protein, partial [Escherichia coli]|uniref:hypothetical protein n=1 Tax=Escherichia coli TaxID=562 RepID=UPI001BFCE50A
MTLLAAQVLGVSVCILVASAIYLSLPERGGTHTKPVVSANKSSVMRHAETDRLYLLEATIGAIFTRICLVITIYAERKRNAYNR